MLIGGVGLISSRKVGNYSFHAVLSGSMGSALPTGSLAIVKAEPQYVLGDIVLFPEPGATHPRIMHRIMRTKRADGRTLFETKGDANTNGDRWQIPEPLVAGKVVGRVPGVGYLSGILRSVGGFIAFSLILLAIFVLPVVYRAWSEWRGLYTVGES